MVTGRVPFVETTARSYQDHHVNTPPSSLRPLRSDVSTEPDDPVVAMLAKRPLGRMPRLVYDTLLPLVRSGPADASDDRDPRRPFLRPFAPAPRAPVAVPAARPPRTALAPLTIDEALNLHGHVAQLIQDSLLQHSIDVLDDAVDRAAHDPALQLEMRIELATTLYMADEFTRAAAVFDEVLPKLHGSDDVALLRYYAGVSPAEIGDIEAAIEYPTAFLTDVDPDDALYRDSIHVNALDRRIGQIRAKIGKGA
jgi:tetratricopeptide (TPR) repeat protein